MTPERWQKVKLILEEAIEAEPLARASLLDKHCGSDTDLRNEVESLLGFDNSTTGGLEQDAFSSLFGADLPKIPPGTKIGKYNIIREIGTGGMGSVFLAERSDGDFEQKVAIKIIRLGLQSEDLRRRFVRERQILASLEHPNIARLIDGGTTDNGEPFLVMEYVEGTPLIEYADANGLKLEERLDLFREVCSAVTFAHQKLIIHRDLKPSNILITTDGKAKLLDFGIAKILKTEFSDQTLTQAFAFTPDYASPEQIRGEELSTATDVYSLGIILYELLTGSRPFRFAGKNVGDIVRTATQAEPPLPSTISTDKDEITLGRRAYDSKLKGDLDNIILKALKKEPMRRYSSVEQFSEDIRRYLKGLPVLARQDTLRYRAGKFTRRNPLVVGAVSLAFIILIGGILTTTYQARQANAEREKAELRLRDVRALANSFIFEINEEIKKSPISARELLVRRALEYLDKLAAESAGNIELKSELAAGYEKIGEIQAEIFQPNTGKTAESLASHQKALQLREEVFAAEPTPRRAADISNSRRCIGDILLTIGKLSEARTNYREAVSMLEPQLALDPKNVEVRRMVASGHSMLGQSIVRSGTLSEALESYEKALKIYQAVADENSDIDKYNRSVGIVQSYIGYVKMEMGKTDEAVECYRRWLDIQTKIVERNADNRQFRGELATAHTWFGVALSEQGKISDAQAHFAQGIAIQEKIFSADKESLGEEYSLADCYLEFGKAMIRNDLPEPSIANLEKALASYERIWQRDKQNLMVRHRIANAKRFLADAFAKKNQLPKAQEYYVQANNTFKELIAVDAENIDWQQDLAMSYRRLGEFAMEKSDKSLALSNLQQALPIFERLSSNSPENFKRNKELKEVRSLIEQFPRS